MVAAFSENHNIYLSKMYALMKKAASCDITSNYFRLLCDLITRPIGHAIARHLFLRKVFLFFSLQFIIVLSHLEIVDLHEGLVRVQGVFNRRGARFTNLTGAFHVWPGETQKKSPRTGT